MSYDDKPRSLDGSVRRSVHVSVNEISTRAYLCTYYYLTFLLTCISSLEFYYFICTHLFLYTFPPVIQFQTKLNIDVNDEAAVRSVVKSHLEGLAWVLSYYHQGCSSWTWFFPELYSPLGTDFKNLASINLEFDQGVPFTPLLQLLSVLPPQSGSFLPKSYEATMTAPNSPLAPYYPKDFEVDANGKKNAWECIVRIPFINSTLLVDEISKINHKETLTEVERLRNILGEEHRFPPPGRKSKSSDTSSSGSKGSSSTSTVDGRDFVNDKFEQDSLSFNRGGSGGWGNALVDNRRPPNPNYSGNGNSNNNNNPNFSRSSSSSSTGDNRSNKRR